MYRHVAESIKETSTRNFITQIEKDKFNNYDNIMRRKDDSYSKTEVENKIKELSDATYGTVEADYVSEYNTLDGYVKDLELYGNTIQNQDNLEDIKSVGKLQEDGTYKMSIVSHGKNLFDINGFNYNEYIRLENNKVILSGSNSTVNIKKLLKLKPNTKYTMSIKAEGNQYAVLRASVDKNATWHNDLVSMSFDRTKQTFTTPSDGIISIGFTCDANKTTSVWDIQLEEGSIATSYEPYKESRVDINLPCQLEKVGDISDRLYYDEDEKAWCIEKNIDRYTFTGYEDFTNGPIDNSTIALILDSSILNCNYINYNTPLFISKKYIIPEYQWVSSKFNNEVFCGINLNENVANKIQIYFKIALSGLTKHSECINYIQQNPFEIVYKSNLPQKIILPLDTQIQLNSFANKTHIYMVSGEVEGTIKATLPKSLGASVQTLNDKTDMMIDRIKNVETLKEGQNLSYESDKGYVVCENTNNGQIDNIKIEGKTLVNLTFGNFNTAGNSNFTIINDNTYQKECKITNPGSRVITKAATFKKNTDYTIIADIRLDSTLSNNILISFYNGDKFTIEGKSVTKPTNGLYTKYVTKLNPKGNDVTGISIGYHDTLPLDTVLGVRNLIVLEGDWVNKELPSNYFEGLMSVGGDVDEIKVLSRKEDGNLWNSEVIRGFINADTGVEDTVGGHWAKSKDFIRVKPNTTYYVSSNKLLNGILFFNKNKQIITTKFVNNDGYIIATSPSNCEFVRLRFRDATVDLIDHEQITDIMLIQSSTTKSYVPYKSHTKSLLYYNDLGELVPVPELHEWDSIEKHSDGKWYYHKRSEKIVFDGSSDEDWKLNTSSETTQSFRCAHNTNMIQNLICDRFIHDSISSSNGIEGILISKVNDPNEFSIEILKTKLSSLDVAGFKTWLSSNNVTVVYELAEEQVYECVNLNLDTYDNETMVMCNSGAISPNISLNISSHIGNTVSILRERLKQIEEAFTKDKISQNTFQLNTMYSSDKLVFSVNIYACSINEYDEDLFTLITEVLLAGKDNYNLTKMEEIIDFYTMIGKLSFDMADVLFEIIENQINPPVIEIPEEEITILPEI